MADLLTLDIETSARIGLFFGSTYKAHIAKVVQDSFVMGFSWKPMGKRVQSCYIWDFPLYKKEPRNDINVITKYLQVVEGRVVIGQNSRQFDDKVMLGRVIIHQLPKPEFTTIDTLDIRKVARYDSHKLDDVAKTYGFGGKLEHEGIDLWWDCMCGVVKAQKKMVRYCERDVILTEKKYLRERPYYKNHPALNVMDNEPDKCPVCAKGPLVKNGCYTTKTNSFQVWRCKNCGAHPRSRQPDYRQALERMDYVTK